MITPSQIVPYITYIVDNYGRELRAVRTSNRVRIPGTSSYRNANSLVFTGLGLEEHREEIDKQFNGGQFERSEKSSKLYAEADVVISLVSNFDFQSGDLFPIDGRTFMIEYINKEMAGSQFLYQQLFCKKVQDTEVDFVDPLFTLQNSEAFQFQNGNNYEFNIR